RHCHISTRTRQWIAHQCNQRLTEQYISEMPSFSTPTVRRVIDQTVQALNREVNRTRIQVMNHCRHKDRPLYNKFKRYWKLLLKHPKHLSRTAYKKYRLFPEWKTSHGIVQYLLAVDETLASNHEYAHALAGALKQGDIGQFNTLIHNASAQPLSPGMRRVLRTFKKYIAYISHTLGYTHLTNGSIEGINNSIKTLKRVAFGYRNFAHFRDQILLTTRLYQPETKRASNSLIAS